MRIEGFCIYCGEEQLETSYWRAGNAYFVRCKNCKATGPSIADTEEEAIRLFNIRHDAAKQTRLEYTKPTTLSQLQADNAKLRELVVEVFKCAMRGADCETCKVTNDGYACLYIMHELGVEVDV